MFADFHCQEVMKFRVLSLHECFLPLEAADLITISLSHASLNKSTDHLQEICIPLTKGHKAIHYAFKDCKVNHNKFCCLVF